jgi:hypothetical protein
MPEPDAAREIEFGELIRRKLQVERAHIDAQLFERTGTQNERRDRRLGGFVCPRFRDSKRSDGVRVL